MGHVTRCFIARVHFRHGFAHYELQGPGAGEIETREAAVGGERIFQQGVEHGATAIDIELGPVDLVHLDALHGEAHQFRVAVVFRAVGSQGHGRCEGRDETQVHHV